MSDLAESAAPHRHAGRIAEDRCIADRKRRFNTRPINHRTGRIQRADRLIARSANQNYLIDCKGFSARARCECGTAGLQTLPFGMARNRGRMRTNGWRPFGRDVARTPPQDGQALPPGGRLNHGQFVCAYPLTGRQPLKSSDTGKHALKGT